MAKGLTPKQERFCHLYIQYGDMAKAYKEAYDSSRMSQATIRRKAVEVAEVPKVAATIRQLRQEVADNMQIDAERVLQELAAIAFANLRHLYDDDGNMLPPEEWPEEILPAVSSIKTRDLNNGDRITEVKLWPKTAALEALSRHLGLFERDNQQRAAKALILHDPSRPEVSRG